MKGSIASAVILAAGLGTRMKSATPKVLHEVCGLPILTYVLQAVLAVEPERLIVVLGHGHEKVRAILPPEAEVVLQLEQRGTGHALMCAADLIAEGPLMVLPGDTPLVTDQVLAGLVAAHKSSGAEAAVLTMRLPDPSGYGRVIRRGDGSLLRIVEHRDAGPGELAVDEVNTGMYVLPGRETLRILEHAGTGNAQGEIYLTDVVEGLNRAGRAVAAHLTDSSEAALGVNSRVELAVAQDLMRRRLLRDWMLAGVTVDDPSCTHIDSTVVLEPDVRLLPFCSLRGQTRVARGSVIGPGSTLVDTVAGEGCTVCHSYAEGAILEAGVSVGPFTYLHPDAHLLQKAKAGAFREIE